MSRRHPRRWITQLLGVLLVALTACGTGSTSDAGSSAAGSRSPAATPTPSAPPESTPPQAISCVDASGTTDPPWATQANGLLTTAPTRAEEVYRAELAKNPTDPCAIQGLGVVGAWQKKLADEKEATSTRARRAGKTWTDAVADWVTPLGPPLAAGGAALLLLLVLGRLLTSWAVPPSAVGPSPFACWTVWSAGLTAATASVTAPVVVVARSGPPGLVARPPSWWVVVVILAVVVAVAGATGVLGLLPRGRRPTFAWGPVVMLPAAAVIMFRGAVNHLWLAVPAAVVGVAALATAQALLLRLTLVVNDTVGKSDAAQAAYLLSRLADLGSRPPAGLKVPEQTDVTALPADALTALPQGKLASALFNLLRALLPPTPWRVLVTVHDTRLISVAISRGGRTAEPVLRITAADLGAAGGSAAADDAIATSAVDPVVTRQLLTAAAAHVLLELSKRHRLLRQGLCGTVSWRSLALHAIATAPGTTVPVERKKQLLDLAVAVDPDNALARVARLAYDAVDGPAALEQIDEEIDRVRLARDGVDAWRRNAAATGRGTDEGWDPLLLRLRFQMAAITLNACLDDVPEAAEIDDASAAGFFKAAAAPTTPAPSALHQEAAAALNAYRAAVGRRAPTVAETCPLDAASIAAEALVNQIESRRSYAHRRQMQNLLGEVDAATFYLVLTLAWLRKRNAEARRCDECRLRMRRLTTWAWGQTQSNGPIAARPAYDRACWRSTTGSMDAIRAWADAARADLRTAVAAYPDLGVWARTDPSLKPLRDRTRVGRTGVAEFWQIVGEPPVTALLDLPVFEGYRKALTKLDLVDAAEIALADAEALREATSAPDETAARWQDVARLALPSDDLKAVPIELLGVVVALGVRTRADLLARRRNPPWQSWNNAVLDRLIDDGISLSRLPKPEDWRR